MARAGLSPALIVRTAAQLVDQEGPAALTLARVAGALDVKPPSLYQHVDGQAGLVRQVALDGLQELVDSCRTALLGRSGSAGLRAFGAAYRGFARARPGVYPLTQEARPGDREFHALTERLRASVGALLAGFRVTGADLVHATRMLRSILHGFALLEIRGGFGLEVDMDESFAWLLDLFERSLPQAGGQPKRSAASLRARE